MRIKIAFLTVIALNAMGVAAYWLWQLISLETTWFLSTPFGAKMFRQTEDGPIFMDHLGAVSVQLLFMMASGGMIFLAYMLCKTITVPIYNKIDKLFPEKKP